MRELETSPAPGQDRTGQDRTGRNRTGQRRSCACPRGAGRILRPLGTRRWRRGFSLFGVLLGLGLAAVVIVGAVGTYNAARESANRTAALTLLSQLRANVEAAFAGAPSYGDRADLVPAIDRRGGIPGGARVESGGSVSIRHPFGGAVTVLGGPAGVTNRFRITFKDVDDAICAALGDAYAGRSRARAGLVQMLINGTTLSSPVTNAQVTTNCDDGDAANDIGFVFG